MSARGILFFSKEGFSVSLSPFHQSALILFSWVIDRSLKLCPKSLIWMPGQILQFLGYKSWVHRTHSSNLFSFVFPSNCVNLWYPYICVPWLEEPCHLSVFCQRQLDPLKIIALLLIFRTLPNCAIVRETKVQSIATKHCISFKLNLF